MRPSCTGPMFATRSSGTRTFPVAAIDPAICCGATISNSMAELCAGAAALDGWPEAFEEASAPLLPQPAQTAAARSDADKSVGVILSRNISRVISPSCLLLQRRRGRKLKVEQRHLVVEERLVITREGLAPRAYGVEEVERGTLAGLQCELRQVLNLIHLRQHARAVKLDAPLLKLERDQSLVHVARHLVGNKLLLSLRALSVYQRLGALALI